MQSLVSITSLIFFTTILALSTWQLAQNTRIQELSYRFTHSKRLKLGVLCLGTAPTLVLGEILYSKSTQPQPQTGVTLETAATSGIEGTSVLTGQIVWMAAIAILSLYVHLTLFGAYKDYQRYPSLTQDPDTSQMWVLYRRWTYLFRTQYKSAIFIAPIVSLVAVTGIQIGIPELVCFVIAIHHSILMMVSSHGSNHIQYQKEKRLLQSPDGHNQHGRTTDD